MKTLNQISALIIMILIPTIVSAQKSDSLLIQQKLDSLIIMQKQLKTMQQEIYTATVYFDPLIGKRFGIEINPTSFFLGNFTGGIQLFNVDRKAEISIPISFYKPWTSAFGFTTETNQIYDLNIDLQYRRFIGEHQNGFWIGGGARLTIANEQVTQYNSYSVGGLNYVSNSNSYYEKNNYFGIMAGVGYRYYTQSGFYWGTSISLGKYLNVTETDYNSNNYKEGYRSSIFYDFELLKVGYTF